MNAEQLRYAGTSSGHTAPAAKAFVCARPGDVGMSNQIIYCTKHGTALLEVFVPWNIIQAVRHDNSPAVSFTLMTLDAIKVDSNEFPFMRVKYCGLREQPLLLYFKS